MSKIDEAQRVRLARLEGKTGEPDTSDIPEAPPGAWETAEVGKFYRAQKQVLPSPQRGGYDPPRC